jgi:fatty-acyl-CoA synthase
MHYFTPLTPAVFLERTGKVYAGSTAIQDGHHVVTYGELLRRSRRLASVLEKHGVAYGDAVGLLSENAPEVIEANFGIPGAGGVVVTLNPHLPTGDIVKQLRMVSCRVLLVSAACLRRHAREVLSDGGARLLIIFGGAWPADAGKEGVDYERALASGRDDSPLDEAIRSELDPAVINFTSGTTGAPKGAVMSHRGAYLHALGQVLMLALSRESKYLWTLPMFHVNGWGHIWANAAVGAAQRLAELPGPTIAEEAAFTGQLVRAGVTHLAGAPRLLRRIVALEGAATALRGCTVVTGGAAPTRALVTQLESLGIRLIHQYGLNETFGPYVVCEEQPEWSREDRDARANLRCRQGVAAIHVGSGLRVLGADGKDVPADGKTAGEVAMSGNTVALGYYGSQEATDRAFVDGWFRSGDLAVVHPDGYLEIKDRIKDLIYVETDYGWENISSIEVENILVQCPGVADAALVGLQGKDAGGAELVAVVEPSRQPPPSADELREFCRRHLPRYMRPSVFLWSPIPKTATGKIRKDVLLAQVTRELAAPSAPPQEAASSVA